MKPFVDANAQVILIACLTLSIVSQAQEDKSKRPSPPATASGKIGEATITFDYSSPSVKGRKIFGGLLPYDKVWRAGANEATVFTTDKDINIEGKKLGAGKYSFFATPGEKEWTVYFNSETGQWGDKEGGDTNMDPSKTVLSVRVKPTRLANLSERLVYVVKPDGFLLQWEYTEIFVRVK